MGLFGRKEVKEVEEVKFDILGYKDLFAITSKVCEYKYGSKKYDYAELVPYSNDNKGIISGVSENKLTTSGPHAYVKEKGVQLETTDLCSILGGVDLGNKIEGRENPNARDCNYWTSHYREEGINDKVMMSYINGSTLEYTDSYRNKQCACRPASWSRAVAESPETGVKGKGWYEVEYGVYPKNSPAASEREWFESEFKKGNVKQIKDAGFTFYSNSSDNNGIRFHRPEIHKVYKIDEYEKLYTLLIASSFKENERGRLLDGTRIENGTTCLVEIEPCKWAVDEETGRSISVAAAYSGVPYDERSGRFYDCKGKYYYKFENEYFAKDLIQGIDLNNTIQVKPQAGITQSQSGMEL